VAGKPVPANRAPGGGGGPRPDPGAVPAYPPYAEPDGPSVYTRPIYPFPAVAQYKGSGDATLAANYQQVKGPMTKPQVFTNEAVKMVGPDNQKFYLAQGDELVPDPQK
jgi:feruloyl esterase